jgi:hypothetical protein
MKTLTFHAIASNVYFVDPMSGNRSMVATCDNPEFAAQTAGALNTVLQLQQESDGADSALIRTARGARPGCRPATLPPRPAIAS